jgi:hypothetical protein
MRAILILTAMLLSAVPAAAQHAHGSKGPNGDDGGCSGVHAELITSGNTITFNIVDEASKPVTTNGFTGSALVASGAEKETITLSPAGDSALKGEAKKAILANASVTLMLKTKAENRARQSLRNRPVRAATDNSMTIKSSLRHTGFTDASESARRLSRRRVRHLSIQLTVGMLLLAVAGSWSEPRRSRPKARSSAWRSHVPAVQR